MLMQLYKDEPMQDYSFEDVLSHKRLTNSIYMKCRFSIRILKRFMETEDIDAELNLSIWKAYKTYNNIGIVFSTYALHVAANDMRRLLNYSSSEKRNSLHVNQISLNQSVRTNVNVHDSEILYEEIISNNDTSIEQQIFNSLCINSLKGNIKSSTEYEKDLLRYLIGNIRLMDIVGKYGRYKQYHLNNIQTLKNKLKISNEVTRPEPKQKQYDITTQVKYKIIKIGKVVGIFKDFDTAKNVSESIFKSKVYNINAYLVLNKFIGQIN